MKSYIFSQERDESEERFSTVAIQSLLWAIYHLALFHLLRLQCQVEIVCCH